MSWIWGSLIMDNPLLALRKGNLPEDAQSFQVGQVWEVSTDTKLVLGQSQNGQVVVLKTQYSHWWWEKHEKTRYLKAVLKDRNARTLSCFLLKSMILGPLFLVDFCCPIGFIAICLCEIGSTGIWSGPSQHLARLSTVKKQQIDLRWMGFFHRNQWFSRSTSRLTDFQKIFPEILSHQGNSSPSCAPWQIEWNPHRKCGDIGWYAHSCSLFFVKLHEVLISGGLNSPLLVILIQTCHQFTSWHRVVKIPVTRTPMNNDQNHNLWGAMA